MGNAYAIRAITADGITPGRQIEQAQVERLEVELAAGPRAATGTLRPHARNRIIAPSPPNPAGAAVNVSNRNIFGMSLDATKLWSGIGTILYESTDDGVNWTLLYTFTDTVKGIRQLANGQLVVSLDRTPGVKAGSLWLSTGYPGGSLAFTKVLDANNPGAAFEGEWGMSTHGTTVVVCEYGDKPFAGRVYLSRDSGVTWSMIFNHFDTAPDLPDAHSHGAAFDHYWDRIWVVTGDGFNRSVKYSDDWGVTWRTVTTTNGPQPVAVLPMKTCVLFISDSAPNGVMRCWRVEKDVTPVLETAYEAETGDTVTIIGGMPFWRGDGYPALLPFIRASTGPGYLVATYDGTDFFKLWTDTATYGTPEGLRTALGPTATGKIVGNRLMGGNYYRMTFSAPTWMESNSPTPVFRLERYLRMPVASVATNASCPDNALFALASDFDLRVRVAMDDWTPAASQVLACQYYTDSGWYFYVTSAGRLEITWFDAAGAARTLTSTVSPTVTDGSPLTVRVVIDKDNGAGQAAVSFYTSADYEPATRTGSWTQLGTTVVGVFGPSSFFNASSPLEVGSLSSGQSFRTVGRFYWLEWRDGIDGTVVADPDFRHPMWKIGDTTNAWYFPTGKDSRGNVWTLKGQSAARIEADKVIETVAYVRDTATIISEAQVTGLVGDLSTLTTAVAGRSLLGHTHPKSDISATGTFAVSDIPTLTLSKISDAGTAAAYNVGTTSGTIGLLTTGGKFPQSFIPTTSITLVTVVASQAAMLALSDNVGQVAKRSDNGLSYWQHTSPATVLANWVTVTDVGVTSVNTLAGAVSLTTATIPEDPGFLYFTNARAIAAAPAVTLSAAVDAIFSLSGQQFTLDAQTANTVLRGGAVPAFGALVPADVPQLSDAKITFDTVRAAHLVNIGPLSGSAAPGWRLLDASDMPTGIPEANITNLVADLAGKASATTQINTAAPLTGGGNIAGTLNLAISAATASAAGSMSAADKAEFDRQKTVVNGGTVTTSYTPDLSAGATFNITAGALSITINAPTNAVDGRRTLWKFRQDGTGGRAIVLSSAAGGFAFTADIPSYTASTAPNALDHVLTIYDSVKGKHIVTSVIKGA